MSTPPAVSLPRGVEAINISTPRGQFAALQATPPAPVGRHAAAARTIVLLPGWTGSKEDFAVLLPLLAQRGWQAVTYDQRGQYETYGDPAADYSLEGLAADAHAVLDVVAPGAAADLLGHSLGGLVAQWAALVAPERWRSLVLFCSGPGAFADPEKVQLLRTTVDALRTLPLEQVYEAKVRHDNAAAQPAGPPPEDVQAFLRRRFLRNSPVSLTALTTHLVEAPDRVEELRRLPIPVHVVHGAEDDGWPVAVQGEMAARLGAPAHVVADAGHSPNVENPVATADLLATLLG